MPLFKMDEAELHSLRENPHIHDFDFTNEEEALALNDKALELHKATIEHIKRVNAWIDEKGIETQMKERLDAAFQAANVAAMTATMEVAMGQRDGDFAAFVRTQDPIWVANRLGSMSRMPSDTLKELDAISDFASHYSPGLKEHIQHMAVEVVKMAAMTSIAYDTAFTKLLERVEHGVPEWNAKDGCERPLTDTSVPTMDGYTPAAVAAKAVEQAEDDKVAVRLLSGLGDLFDS